jgi:hypothetical protein
MKFDRKYFDEMLKELIEQESHCEPEIEVLEKLESVVEGLGAVISKSGVSEVTIKEAIEKHPVAVMGLVIIEAIQSNASQERYIRLEQMKLQAHQTALIELLAERLGDIDTKLETTLENHSDAINAHGVAITLCGRLDKAAGDISHNLYTVSKDIYTLHSQIENLIIEMREKKK